MKIAYFDTVSGISGDMVLSAFISAGISVEGLREDIDRLNLQGVEIEVSRICRNGITAIKTNIIYSSKHEKGRRLEDIYEIIDNSALSEKVKVDSKKIFNEIAQAESKIHNVPVEKLHFHELSAIDSIIDVVGTAICLEKFQIKRVYSSALKVGCDGLVNTAHGKLPIPSPATLEILRGYPIVFTDIPFELTTPTGAAIIKALSSGVLSYEKFRLEKIGYGAGEKEIKEIPNLLRVIIGELESSCDFDELVQVETNIDDMNPEIYPYVTEKLLESGANDVYIVPIIMKKGRPGVLISILVNRSILNQVLRILFTETTTIGVRIQQVERKKVVREIKEIQSRFGLVKMKLVKFDGEEKLLPEFEECKMIAKREGIPIAEVFRILLEESNTNK